jgi:hypothetical protein
MSRANRIHRDCIRGQDRIELLRESAVMVAKQQGGSVPLLGKVHRQVPRLLSDPGTIRMQRQADRVDAPPRSPINPSNSYIPSARHGRLRIGPSLLLERAGSGLDNARIR